MPDVKRTVMEVFEGVADRQQGQPTLKWKQGSGWKSKSWGEYRDEVRLAAKAMIGLGLEPGKGVSIVGFNCAQWVIGNVAAIYAGARPAGIYTTSSPEQCQYVTSHCEAQLVICEDVKQLAKFLEIRDQLPEVKAFVLMRGDSSEADVYGWPEFLDKGKNVDDAELQGRIDAQSPDDVCTFIYTSGTTGAPKAVMISHDNMTWTAKAALDTLGYAEGDLVVSYLPLSHIAEQIMSLHGPMVTEGCTAFAESIDKLGDNLKELRPTLFLAVPRVWEKIQAKITAAASANAGLKKKIGSWARSQGLAGGYADQKGQPRPMLFGLANKLVFTKVREQLGLDRSRIQITSAAPISKATLEFFLSLGVPIMEVYGMSECTGPATVSVPGNYVTGKVGPKLPGTELKIADDGEVLMRGRHVFKGYFKNPEATAETIDKDGWLHSGDIGEIDDRGFLQITDRKKDILITAGGENIAPQMLEGLLKGIPAVSQAVVVGDRQKHLSALLTLDETILDSVLAESGSSAKTMAEAAQDETFKTWMMQQVEGVNADLARVQTIKKIAVLPEDLSIEGGDMTPTMKVKRKVVNKKYADIIDGFYGG
ncbi:MAG: AMP-binding protein [Nannocystaceae bacterium]|nr:AMP-binding protein [Nannocystaceae bacterium]